MKIYTLLKIDDQGREIVLMVSEDMNKIFSKINYYKEMLYLQTRNGGKKGALYVIKKYSESDKIDNCIDGNHIAELSETTDISSYGGVYGIDFDNTDEDELEREDTGTISNVVIY